MKSNNIDENTQQYKYNPMYEQGNYNQQQSQQAGVQSGNIDQQAGFSENQMQQQYHQQEKLNIKRLQDLIENGLPSIKQKIDKAVLVLGNTGSGKSTLINGLIGNKLNGFVDEDGNSKIELADNQDGAKIGDTLVSETTVPKYWVNKETKVGYFDCPGFGDNKGAEQDIANAVFIQQLFTITKEVKILIVAPEVQFDLKNERAGSVLKFIDQISSLFPRIGDIIDSVCLVVTKAEDKYVKGKLVREASANHISKTLELIKSDHEKSHDSKYFKDESSGFTQIFKMFLNSNRIGIFKSPSETGVVDIPPDVIKMINSISYAKAPKVNPPISPSSFKQIAYFYSQLENYAKEQTTNLIECLKQFINTKDYKEILNILQIVQKISDLKTDFETKDISTFSDAASETYVRLMEKFCKVVDFKNKTTLEQELNWMDKESMNKKIKSMSDEEKDYILNRNHFTFILKSIEFVSRIEPPQVNFASFSHIGIDEIKGIISDKKGKLQAKLSSDFLEKFGVLGSDVAGKIKEVCDMAKEKISQIDYRIVALDKKISDDEELSDEEVKELNTYKSFNLGDEINNIRKHIPLKNNMDAFIEFYKALFNQNRKNFVEFSEISRFIDDVNKDLIPENQISINWEGVIHSTVVALSELDTIILESNVTINKAVNASADADRKAYKQEMSALKQKQEKDKLESEERIKKQEKEIQDQISQMNNLKKDQVEERKKLEESIKKIELEKKQETKLFEEKMSKMEERMREEKRIAEEEKQRESQRVKEQIEKQNKEAEKKSAEADYTSAQQCFNNKSYFDAYDKISKALPIFEKHNQSNYKHYELKGKCEIRIGKSQSEVDQSFKNAADKVTNPYLVIFTKGDEYLDFNKYDLAIKSYEESLNYAKTGSEKASCNCRIGNVYHNKKADYKTAAEFYNKAYIETNDKSDEATYKSNEGNSWKCLANNTNNINDKIQYYNTSISCYETAIGKDSKQEYKNSQASACNGLGNVYYNKKDYKTAAEFYNKAYLATNDKSDEATYKSNEGDSWKCLANNTNNINDKIDYYKSSISCYDTAINKDSKQEYKNSQASAYNGLGNVYYNKKDYKTAVEYYEKACKNTNEKSYEASYKSDAADCWKSLADNTSSIDDKIQYYNRSITIYQDAYDKEPKKDYSNSQASACNSLGNVYHNDKKNYNMAVECYERAYGVSNDKSGKAIYKSNAGNSWKCLANNTSNINDKIKCYNNSINCYETAINNDPKQDYKNSKAWAHNGLGCVYYNQSLWNSAYDNFKLAYGLSNVQSDYVQFKKNANNCFGTFSGADGGRSQINFILESSYQNPAVDFFSNKTDSKLLKFILDRYGIKGLDSFISHFENDSTNISGLLPHESDDVWLFYDPS